LDGAALRPGYPGVKGQGIGSGERCPPTGHWADPPLSHRAGAEGRGRGHRGAFRLVWQWDDPSKGRALSKEATKRSLRRRCPRHRWRRFTATALAPCIPRQGHAAPQWRIDL